MLYNAHYDNETRKRYVLSSMEKGTDFGGLGE